jgi:hypothetical protein
MLRLGDDSEGWEDEIEWVYSWEKEERDFRDDSVLSAADAADSRSWVRRRVKIVVMMFMWVSCMDFKRSCCEDVNTRLR